MENKMYHAIKYILNLYLISDFFNEFCVASPTTVSYYTNKNNCYSVKIIFKIDPLNHGSF